ncbi:MAG: alginate lyase family protein [Planctomycetota bacterium]|nr:alginate lyase family protein [Planctomycetota bacterium]
MTDLYLQHRFDLLGSGWVPVTYGVECSGLAGHQYPAGKTVQPDRLGEWLAERVTPANLPKAQVTWQLVRAGYQPIDWQLDFKSGYCWSSTTRSSAIRYGGPPGADVKVPWELARMQHLPQLAWAYMLAVHPESGLESPARYAEELEHEVLDFIATNPPRWGVNWSCTMDVAIRVSNWFVAHDLLAAAGWSFRPDFERRFVCSVYDHGRHIVSHLEWHPRLRANHYLADIAGLVLAAAFLPLTEETGRWLTFGIRELVQEVARQFTPDGANFEASTCYHRLSAEMVVYATAIVLALPADKIAFLQMSTTLGPRFRPGAPADELAWRYAAEYGRAVPFPEWYFERIEKMAAFTAAITYPDKQVVQIGDNDSGRFLKVWPAYGNDGLASSDAGDNAKQNVALAPPGRLSESYGPTEDILDHRHLVSAIRGLRHAGRTGSVETPDVEEEFVRRLIWRQTTSQGYVDETPVGNSQMSRLAVQAQDVLHVFPDFGLCVYRVGRLMLTIHCGPVGQNGHGGHAHNDQLSFELAVDDMPVIMDPGTYVYTPLPDERNRFRSTAMHNTLTLPGSEQNSWVPGPEGLFSLSGLGQARVLTAEPHRFVGEFARGPVRHRRTVHIDTERLEMVDECSVAGDKFVAFHLAPTVQVENLTSGNGVVCRLPGASGASVVLRTLDNDPFHGTWSIQDTHYSRGYGLCASTKSCLLTSPSGTIALCIEILTPSR